MKAGRFDFRVTKVVNKTAEILLDLETKGAKLIFKKVALVYYLRD